MHTLEISTALDETTALIAQSHVSLLCVGENLSALVARRWGCGSLAKAGRLLVAVSLHQHAAPCIRSVVSSSCRGIYQEGGVSFVGSCLAGASAVIASRLRCTLDSSSPFP